MNTKNYNIYVPTEAEIVHVTTSAARRHPELASRIEKAAAILLDGALQLDALAWDVCQVARWKVASQSGKGAYVIVNGGCPCYDARINGAAHCKHGIAVASYMKILRNHLNSNIQVREIDLGIVPDGTFNAWAKGLGHVHVRKNGATYDFCNAASAVRYSIWLAAQPVAVEWPTHIAISQRA